MENLFLSIGVLSTYEAVLQHQIWRFVSSMFLHAGIVHIFMNMLSLWFVGRITEISLGKSAYIIIYFISGIIGGLFSVYTHPSTYGLGASGAIFGVFGALVGMVIVKRKELQHQFQDFMKNVGVILLLNLIIGVSFDSVDLVAHIAGLIAGIIGGFMVAKKPNFLWFYLIVSILFIVIFYNYLYNYFSSFEIVDLNSF